MNERRHFSGAVLTGGRSTRMGADKALMPVDGVPMALRVANAMRAAGAADVKAIGGDAESLHRLGLRTVPDAAPGEGPLGGIISALRASRQALVVVTACDMPWIEAEQIAPLVDALARSDQSVVAVSAAGSHPQPLHAAWRVSGIEELQQLFDAGERAPSRAMRALAHLTIELGDGRWATDLDTPDH